MMAKRESFLDIARVLSCFAVYMIHYIAVYKTTFNIGHDFLDNIKTFCNFGVPCFFILSGYLSIFKKYSIKTTIKKIAYLYISTVAVNILCLIFNTIYRGSTQTTMQIITDSFLLKTVTHLWFMPVIISIYLFLPIFSNLDAKCYIYIFTIITVFSYFKSYIPIFNELNISIPFSWCYVYFLFGGMLKIIDRKYYGIICAFYLAFMVFNFFLKGISCISQYQNIATLSLSLFVFTLCGIMPDINKSNILQSIANVTYPIYLFHPFVIHLLFTVLKLNLSLIILCATLFVSFIVLCVIFIFINGILFKFKIIPSEDKHR